MSEPKESGEQPTEDKTEETQQPGKTSEPAPQGEDELQILQGQVAEFRDKYLRGLAESENVRKRLQKERQELVQYAVQNVIVDFLSPLDHLENALKFADQASPDVKHWAVGFQMILEQFKDALTNNGVVSFVSIGEQFDPHLHEAIEMVTTNEYPPGTVIEESLRGYKMGDSLLRPARVKVAKSAPIEAEEASIEAKESENF